MARIRMLSAGLGGSSKYNVNPWGNQGGGNKKQGLPPIRNKSVEFISRSIRIRAWGNPEQRRKVFFINQLGGIGHHPSTMFGPRSDGVKKMRFN